MGSPFFCRANRRALTRHAGLLLIATSLSVGLMAFLLRKPMIATAVEEKPVILLTGFEPFGEQRSPNPSWEGIRNLHNTEWNGFRIVAHQMPVVWGEPLKELQKQIELVRPVAIFSFGQGRSGSMAIESLAKNDRAPIPDNKGQLPEQTKIAPDGPDKFQSSFPCELVAEKLREKGYTIQVSTTAGQYLCEETLYSLELLRKERPELTVAFCHVPPLGSSVGETVVDGRYVQKFVLDYLTAWQSETQTRKAAGIITPTSGGVQNASAEAKNPELPAIRKLVDGYFKSWSDQRMKDYGDCFAEGSVIQEVTRTGEIFTQTKGPFVAAQASYHKSAVHKAIEVPVSTDFSFEAELARAVVYWKLTAGPRVQFGYDHFTLIKQNGEWKIANLVFYGTKDRE